MNPAFDQMTETQMQDLHKFCNNMCRSRLRAEAVNRDKFELGIESEERNARKA